MFSIRVRKTALAVAVAAAAMGASPAFALPAVVTACSVTDLNPTAADCRGFYAGQYLSGSASDVQVQKDALSALGFTWDGLTVFNFQSGLGGATTVNYLTPLSGTTFLGVHYGAGSGSPTPNQGDSTAFYKLDAGASLSQLGLNYGASSDVKVYSTMPAIPEPETYALMLAGLAAVGFMARRRRRQV